MKALDSGNTLPSNAKVKNGRLRCSDNAARCHLLHLGWRAPDFALLDNNGSTFALSDFRDRRNVLLFFHEGMSVRDSVAAVCGTDAELGRFLSADAAVLQIGPLVPTRRASREAQDRVPVVQLFDEGGRVAAAYGCKHSGEGVLTTVYGVDRTGIIRFAHCGRIADYEVLLAFRAAVESA